MGSLHKRRGNVRPSIDKPDKPLVLFRVRVRGFAVSQGLGVGYVEGDRKGQIGPVGTRLIPPPKEINLVGTEPSQKIIRDLLDSGTDRAEDDGEEERLRLSPLVQDFVTDGFNLVRLHALNGLKGRRVFGDERALDQEWRDVGQIVSLSKLFDIADDGGLG